MADKPKASKSPKYQYAEKLKDPRWQKLRLQVFERDGWKCRVCDSETSTLHAHHTYYKTDSEGPWDYNHGSIITLCDQCHEEAHVFLPLFMQVFNRSLCDDGLFVTGPHLMFLQHFLHMIKVCIDSGGENKAWEKLMSSFIEGHINKGGDL
jgi:hypothetical protein